jgi:hypothetical protein
VQHFPPGWANGVAIRTKSYRPMSTARPNWEGDRIKGSLVKRTSD